MNVVDVRYLLSALIQILPVILSLNLIAIFTFKPSYLRQFKRGIILLTAFVMFSLAFNIISLFFLTDYSSYTTTSNIPIISILVSYMCIAMSFGYLLKILIIKMNSK